MDVPGLSLSPVEGGLTGEKIGQASPGNGEIDPAGEQKGEPYGDMAAEKQTQSSPEHQQESDCEVSKVLVHKIVDSVHSSPPDGRSAAAMRLPFPPSGR